MTFAPRIPSLLLTPLLVVGPLFAQTPGSVLQLRVLDSDGATIAPGSRSIKGFSVEVLDGNGAPASDAAVVFRLPDAPATGTFADGSHSAVAYTDATGHAHVSAIQWSSTPGPVTLRVTATRGAAHAGTLVEENLASTSPVAVPTESLAREIAPPAPSAPKVQVLSDIEPSSRAPRAFAPVIRESGSEPNISIVNDPHQKSNYGGSSKKKWIIIGVVAAAAGAGAFMAIHQMGSSAPNLSIGAPTINIGH